MCSSGSVLSILRHYTDPQLIHSSHYPSSLLSGPLVECSCSVCAKSPSHTNSSFRPPPLHLRLHSQSKAGKKASVHQCYFLPLINPLLLYLVGLSFPLFPLNLPASSSISSLPYIHVSLRPRISVCVIFARLPQLQSDSMKRNWFPHVQEMKPFLVPAFSCTVLNNSPFTATATAKKRSRLPNILLVTAEGKPR